LQALKQLGVNRQEVDQAAALLAEKQTRAEIGRLKGRAEQFSGEEQWQQALEAYEAILRLDPNLLFATAGQVAAAKRAELDRSMSNAIDHPLRLQDEGQQSAAGSLLAYARQVEPQGPRLRAQIEALDALLKAVRTPVAVIIESDNLTDITIYHVGRIGPVFTRKIDLKPGTYTVVGSRNGYRDVRKEIIIGADSNEYRYDIRCEEAI
jgi:tetratricopeptide (TPR) repeat protein